MKRLIALAALPLSLVHAADAELANAVAAAAGGPPVPSHHSAIFKIEPEPAIRTGVEATVTAMLALMKKPV